MSPAQDSPPDRRGAARVIAGGAAARLVGLPIGAICMAITAYISIRYVGDENYGYVNLVAMLFLLLPFADFGLGVVVINAISRVPAGKAPAAAELQTIWRVLIRLVVIAFLLITATFVIAAIGGWSKILNLPSDLVGANYATAIALSVFFLAMPLGVGQKILVGIGRVGEMTIITLAAPAVTTAATFLLVAITSPPMYLAIAPAAGTLASHAILMWRALKHLGVGIFELRTAVPAGPPDRLAHAAISYFVVSLGVSVALQSDRLILAHFSTATQLSAYSLMAQMYTPILSVITTGAMALWPAYKHRGNDAGSLLTSSLRTLTGLGFVFGVAFGVASPFLARIISSGEIRPNASLAACFAALIFVMAIHQASALFLTDESGLRFQAYCVVVLAITSVALSVVLAGPLGAAGPVLASVIAVGTAQLLPGILRARKVLKVVSQ